MTTLSKKKDMGYAKINKRHAQESMMKKREVGHMKVQVFKREREKRVGHMKVQVLKKREKR